MRTLSSIFILCLFAFNTFAINNQPNNTNTQQGQTNTPTNTNSIKVIALSDQINVYGLSGVNTRVSVYNNEWLLVKRTWVSTQNLFVPDLLQGTYNVIVENYTGAHATERTQSDFTVEVIDAAAYISSPEKIAIETIGDKITVEGLAMPQNTVVSVYNADWLLVTRHLATATSMAVPDLMDGKYFVRVDYVAAEGAEAVNIKETYVEVKELKSDL
jgi:hypothetical protein